MDVRISIPPSPSRRRGQCPDATPVVISLIQFLVKVPQSAFLLLLAIANAWFAAYDYVVLVAVCTTIHVVWTWKIERKLCVVVAQYDDLRSAQDVCSRDIENATAYVRVAVHTVDVDEALAVLASLRTPMSPLRLTRRDPLEIR